MASPANESPKKRIANPIIIKILLIIKPPITYASTPIHKLFGWEILYHITKITI